MHNFILLFYINTLKKIFIIFLCFLCFFSCKKDENKLPSPTQEGKNILACKVDGVPHIYSGVEKTFNPNGVDYQITSIDIRLSGNSSDYRDLIEIRLFFPGDYHVGNTYVLSSDIVDAYASRYTGNNGTPFRTDHGSGWVRFSRLDSLIASGTFAFTGYRDGDSSVITEGIFDLKNN